MSWLPIILFNMGFASVATLCLLGIAPSIRSPATRRALWLVVLAKFVLPVSLFHLWSTETTANAPHSSDDRFRVVATVEVAADESTPTEKTRSKRSQVDLPAPESKLHEPTVITSPLREEEHLPLSTLLGSGWALTSLFFGLWVFLRMRNLGRATRAEPDAPAEVQALVRRIAARIGLDRIPRAKWTDADVSPFLWPYSANPIIVLPAQLMSQLSRAEQMTAIAHELVHYHRRDHWWRLAELIPAILCWWNPLVWIALRKTHDAEEECCDAFVVERFPQNSEDYAAAIVKAGAFSKSNPAMPVTALTGRSSFLKRRILMILSRIHGSSLTAWGRAAVIAASLGVLPAALVGQDDAATKKPDDTTKAEKPVRVEVRVNEVEVDKKDSKAPSAKKRKSIKVRKIDLGDLDIQEIDLEKLKGLGLKGIKDIDFDIQEIDLSDIDSKGFKIDDIDIDDLGLKEIDLKDLKIEDVDLENVDLENRGLDGLELKLKELVEDSLRDIPTGDKNIRIRVGRKTSSDKASKTPSTKRSKTKRGRTVVGGSKPKPKSSGGLRGSSSAQGGFSITISDGKVTKTVTGDFSEEDLEKIIREGKIDTTVIRKALKKNKEIKKGATREPEAKPDDAKPKARDAKPGTKAARDAEIRELKKQLEAIRQRLEELSS